ncbi:MAG: tetratricopeptide repeat protein, partial [Desulfomonilia bacterium]|nr:tetratricopeptide repeat protein [Desulfomonilia bacterium]
SNKWKELIQTGDNQYRVCLTREQQLRTLLAWGEEKFSQGDLLAAARIFERILHLDRTNSQALNNLGVIQWQLGETASAMNVFQHALTANPDDPDALANLLQAATETGRFDIIDPGLLDILKQKQPANPDIAKIIHAQQKIQDDT